MKEIENYSGYFINEDGQVTSYKRNKVRILKQQKATQSKKGYYQVRLFNKDGDKLHYIHRLVYSTFVGEIPDKMTIDHIDDDTSNNNVNNLKVVTRRENTKKYQNSRPNSLRHKRDEMIKDYEELGTYGKVAEKWGISQSNAWCIIKKVVPKSTYKGFWDGYVEYREE